MQTQTAAAVRKAKTFLARLEQLEEMHREGKNAFQVNALYERWIADAFTFFKDYRFAHETSVLQEITTRIEETYGSQEIEASRMAGRREEIKAMFHALLNSLERSDGEEKRSDLDPFSAILATAAELPSSSQFMIVIGATGVNVDFHCPENLSHAARIHLYQQRFQAAYARLNDDDKLRVAWVLAKELQRATVSEGVQRIKPGLDDVLDKRLQRIGWKIEDQRLVPDNVSVAELFFPKGSEHTAYVKIKEMLQQAGKTLLIVDPYMDSSTFTMLSTLSGKPIAINLLTSAKKLPGDFLLEAKKFVAQHTWGTIEIKTTSDFHDRFIVVDDTIVYHVGASIKDAGKSAFMMSEVEDAAVKNAVLGVINASWSTAVLRQF